MLIIKYDNYVRQSAGQSVVQLLVSQSVDGHSASQSRIQIFLGVATPLVSFHQHKVAMGSQLNNSSSIGQIPMIYTFLESLESSEFNQIKIFENFCNAWRHKPEKWEGGSHLILRYLY